MVAKKSVFSIWLVILFSFCWFPATGHAALVAHWTFDEAGGSTQVVDTVGGLIGNLSATGASLVSGGKAGGALSLSRGANGLVTMGDVLNLGTGPYSFVVWVKTSTTEASTAVLSKHWSTIPAGYFIGINTSGSYGAPNKAWYYNWSNGLEPISVTSVNDDEWHQIVGVRGNGVLKIYVDGLPVESSQTDQGLNDPPPGTPFLVGGYYDSDIGNPLATYTGLIDDIQVFNHNLSDEEVQWLFDHPGQVLTCTPPPSGLVSWWGGDNNALDLAGTNDGAPMNGATYGTGRVGRAFSFDGVDDYVNVPNSPSWNFGTNNFSIDFWVNFNSANNPGYNNFIGHDEAGGSNNKWIFYLKDGLLKFHINGSTGSYEFGSYPFLPVPGTWYHLALTKDGSIYKFFVNGGLVDTYTAATPSVPDANAPLTIGQSESLGYINGLMDEVEIFNRALSADEIASIYNAGSAGQCPIRHVLTVTPSGTGSGSVTGNGLNCSWNGSSSSGTCSVTLYHRTWASLTANPSVGSTFNGWSGGSGSAAGCSGTGACSFSLTQASGVGAPFALNTYNLAVTPSGTGSGSVTGNGIDCAWNGGDSSGTCSVSLNYDTAVSLSAIPAWVRPSAAGAGAADRPRPATARGPARSVSPRHRARERPSP